MKLKKPLVLMLWIFFGMLAFEPTGQAEAQKTISCGSTSLEESECMIRALLDDYKTTYKQLSGGGITEIKALSTYQYRISFAQEKRIDHVTFDFEKLPKGQLKITKRVPSSTSMSK